MYGFCRYVHQRLLHAQFHYSDAQFLYSEPVQSHIKSVRILAMRGNVSYYLCAKSPSLLRRPMDSSPQSRFTPPTAPTLRLRITGRRLL
jgi:hypothetical protein